MAYNPNGFNSRELGVQDGHHRIRLRKTVGTEPMWKRYYAVMLTQVRELQSQPESTPTQIPLWITGPKTKILYSIPNVLLTIPGAGSNGCTLSWQEPDETFRLGSVDISNVAQWLLSSRA